MCNRCGCNNWNEENEFNECGRGVSRRSVQRLICEAGRILAEEEREARHCERRCECEFKRCVRKCRWED